MSAFSEVVALFLYTHTCAHARTHARTHAHIYLYIIQKLYACMIFSFIVLCARPYLNYLYICRQQHIMMKCEIGPRPRYHQNPSGDHFEDSGGLQESDDDVIASFIGNDVTSEVEGGQREFWEDYYTNIDHDINYCDTDESFMTDFLLHGGESDYCDNIGCSQDIEDIMTIPDVFEITTETILTDDVDNCDTSLLSEHGEDYSTFDLDFATSSPGRLKGLTDHCEYDPILDLDFTTSYPGCPEVLSDISEVDSIIDLDFTCYPGCPEVLSDQSECDSIYGLDYTACSPRCPETESGLHDDVLPNNRRRFIRFDDADAPRCFPSTPTVHQTASRTNEPVSDSTDRSSPPRSILRRPRVEPKSVVPTTRRRASETRLENPSEHECWLTMTSDVEGVSQMGHMPRTVRRCISEERMPSDSHRRREHRHGGMRRDSMSERERVAHVRHAESLQDNRTRENDEQVTYDNVRIRRRR